MDCDGIIKVAETTSAEDVNKYLATHRWALLSVTGGHTTDGAPCHLYSLGWYGPYDADNPYEPDSEFPLTASK